MTPLQRRLVIALDEWLWIALALYLHRTHDPAFWWVFAAGFILIYCISYPAHWRAERRLR